MTPFEIYWFNHLIPSLRHLGHILVILSLIGLVISLITIGIQYDSKKSISKWVQITLISLTTALLVGISLRVLFPKQETVELMLKAMEVM